jgi:hypothetical protein
MSGQASNSSKRVATSKGARRLPRYGISIPLAMVTARLSRRAYGQTRGTRSDFARPMTAACQQGARTRCYVWGKSPRFDWAARDGGNC